MKIRFTPPILHNINNYKPIYNILHLFVLSFILNFVFLSTISDTLISKILYFFTTTILLIILSQFKLLLKCFIIFSTIISIFVYPVHNIYGEIDFGYVMSLYYTNTRESLSYVKLIPIKIYIHLIILIIYSYYIMKLNFYKFNNYIKGFLIISICFLPIKKVILFPFNRIYHYSNVLPIKRTLYLIWEFNNVKNEHNKIINESKQPHSWRYTDLNNKNLKQNFVIVIGESARKDFFHCYGFPINNSPFINSTPRIQFNNYISASSTTIRSLSRTLAESQDLKNSNIANNIVSLGKDLGYHTYWISNQEFAEQIDSHIMIMAKSANQSYSLHNDKIRDFKTYPNDKELLPIFDKLIAQKTNKPKLFFIHMYGSHPSISDRVNGKYDEFLISNDISFYNKSIRNTDSFLKHIYNKLRTTNESFNLLYFSDHGIGINNNMQIVHNDKYKEAFEVPLLIFGDNINKTQIINAKRSGIDFIHLFSELSNIKTHNFKRNYTFISEDSYNEIKIINSNNDIKNYNHLKSQPINSIINRK